MSGRSNGKPDKENSFLNDLDWKKVWEHYEHRMTMHEKCLELHRNGDVRHFSELLVGVSDPNGNYSASEHGLGPKILNQNPRAAERLFHLADSFISAADAKRIPEDIRKVGLKYFWIGVGSEASCVLNPSVCWVANTRTIWTYLVMKHGGNLNNANEELALYRDGDENSEMAYQKWVEIHRILGKELRKLIETGSKIAKKTSQNQGR